MNVYSLFFQIPTECTEVMYEAELAVVIGKNGRHIKESEAMDYVGGYVLALDLAAKESIQEARQKGLPWAIAKGFDTATPVSEFIPKSKIPDPDNVRLWLKIDGEIRQDGNTSNMYFKIPYLLSYVSRFMTLERGDMFLMGTPDGASFIGAGHQISAGMGDLAEITFPVVSQ